VARLEAGIATLTTKQETREMFNQIVSMFGAVNAYLQNLQAGSVFNVSNTTQPTIDADMAMHDANAAHNLAPTQWTTTDTTAHQQAMITHEHPVGSGDQTNSQQQQLNHQSQVK
jgi:hypothetical protein